MDDHAARIQAAVFATEHAGGTFDGNLELVAAVAVGSTPVTVDLDVVDAESDSLPEGFSYSAPTMLVLFVFINAMAGGAAMIQSRTLGIYDRMLAGPVTARAIVQGETTTYLTLTLLQSLLIVGVVRSCSGSTGATRRGRGTGGPVGACADRCGDAQRFCVPHAGTGLVDRPCRPSATSFRTHGPWTHGRPCCLVAVVCSTSPPSWPFSRPSRWVC
ncbi:MAG TPA: ABC transporter permease [Jiangellaceae bacterium]|nr:ABC transporter permease [Jiangellaceae bacterium]